MRLCVNSIDYKKLLSNFYSTILNAWNLDHDKRYLNTYTIHIIDHLNKNNSKSRLFNIVLKLFLQIKCKKNIHKHKNCLRYEVRC